MLFRSVVEYGTAAAVHDTVLADFALEEDVDQPPLQVAAPRTIRKVEPCVRDGRPDAVGVESVMHHPGSTMVVAMARNGTDFGIQIGRASCRKRAQTSGQAR